MSSKTKVNYDWKCWFHILTNKIYEGGEAYLVKQSKGILWDTPWQLPKDKSLDPFSFFYFVAQRNAATKSRKEVYKRIDCAFEINRKDLLSDSSFEEGFIFPTPLSHIDTLFFHANGKKNPELLWRVFRQAVNGPENIDSDGFKDVLKIKGVGVRKFTQCLFLINPDNFLPIDKTGVLKFHKELALPSFPRAEKDLNSQDGWKEYQSIMNKVKQKFPGKGFCEVNTIRYLMGKQRWI